MHVELNKVIDLNYNTECATIVLLRLCNRIAHVSGFQSYLRIYVHVYDMPVASQQILYIL